MIWIQRQVQKPCFPWVATFICAWVSISILYSTLLPIAWKAACLCLSVLLLTTCLKQHERSKRLKLLEQFSQSKRREQTDDVPKKSKSEYQVLESEVIKLKHFQNEILDKAPIGACLINNQKKVLAWNQQFASVTGVKAKDIVGKSLKGLPEPWKSVLFEFLSSSKKYCHKDHVQIGNSSFWFNLQKAQFRLSIHNPKSSGTIVLLEDLTEVHTLEMELAYSERFASIGRLASGIAHEIGNPVTGIACLAQNMKAEDSAVDNIEVANLILGQTQRISNIVESLVNFSQTQDNQKPDKGPQLNVLIQEAIRLAKLSTKGKQLEFQNRCPADIELIGDEQRLLQVFLNLLENARDASSPGQAIEIEVEKQHKSVEITIRDFGEGIPTKLQSRIFDPFFTTKDPGEGTGLGLPLVYSILKDHGGHIYISSQLNHGTEAIISLPYRTKDDIDEDNFSTPHQSQQKIAQDIPPIPFLRRTMSELSSPPFSHAFV